MHIIQARDQNEINSLQQTAVDTPAQEDSTPHFEDVSSLLPSSSREEDLPLEEDLSDEEAEALERKLAEEYREQQRLKNLRTCVATGDQLSKFEMLRFVVSPDQDIVFDSHQNLPAQEIWLSPSKKALETAITDRLFAKHSGMDVTVRDDMHEHVLFMIKKNLFDTLCLANRASAIGAGVDQCLSLLREGKAGLYVTASQKGSDARKRIEEKNPDLIVIDYISDYELGRIIGSPQLTHMIVKSGKLCLKVKHWYSMLKELER